VVVALVFVSGQDVCAWEKLLAQKAKMAINQ
jgi:hypothetical protein